jgi:hypothetical protein
MDLILFLHFLLLLQKGIKLEIDMEQCYLEGEVEADGPDEDYSLEHRVSSQLRNLLHLVVMNKLIRI